MREPVFHLRAARFRTLLSFLAMIAVACACGPGCVTETPRRAVIIEGQRLFAPRGLLGRWQRVDRPDEELRFQAPPQPALLWIDANSRRHSFDIQKSIESPDGTLSFELRPVSPGSRPQRRSFQVNTDVRNPAAPLADRLREVFPDETATPAIEYRRAR